MSNETYAAADSRDRARFIICPYCAEWIDGRDFVELSDHVRKHKVRTVVRPAYIETIVASVSSR